MKTPCHGDERGRFSVLYQRDELLAAGVDATFVQDNCSLSLLPSTLRGIHLQLPPFEQGKLVQVLRGRVLDVIVDLRPGSPTHGQHEQIWLDGDRPEQLWVPPGFGHGFCTAEPETIVWYKVDAPYVPSAERTLAWNDPHLAIDWPVGRRADGSGPILSDKDANGSALAEIVAAIGEPVR
jgi:dTDP-4-dehydrorhamnose 3,5-epimerase